MPSINDFFAATLNGIIDALGAVINAIIQFVFGTQLGPVLNTIRSQMPPGLTTTLQGMSTYYGYIEVWFPLSFAFALLTAYYGIVTAMWIVHKIRQLL